MSREKQIESERYEIAEIIAQNYRLNDEQYDASDFEWSAYCVQQAGYRKASEVAREIFEEIERVAMSKIDALSIAILDDSYYIQAIDELKEKYIEGEKR